MRMWNHRFWFGIGYRFQGSCRTLNQEVWGVPHLPAGYCRCLVEMLEKSGRRNNFGFVATVIVMDKRLQNANATYRNIVGHSMLLAAWPPCCDILGIAGSSLKMVRCEPTIPNRSRQGLDLYWFLMLFVFGMFYLWVPINRKRSRQWSLLTQSGEGRPTRLLTRIVMNNRSWMYRPKLSKLLLPFQLQLKVFKYYLVK